MTSHSKIKSSVRGKSDNTQIASTSGWLYVASEKLEIDNLLF